MGREDLLSGGLRYCDAASAWAALLCAAALAFLVAKSLTQPIVQLTAAVEAAGNNSPTSIPVNASGETGVLALAFSRMMTDVKAKTDALETEVQRHRSTATARDRLAERERVFSAAVEAKVERLTYVSSSMVFENATAMTRS